MWFTAMITAMSMRLTENAMYNGYTYDRTTGDIVVSAPYGPPPRW